MKPGLFEPLSVKLGSTLPGRARKTVLWTWRGGIMNNESIGFSLYSNTKDDHNTTEQQTCIPVGH